MGTPERVALVTGATGTIGEAIARQIAADAAFEVVVACRNESKGKKTVERIIKATGNRQVRYELVDLSREASVRALRARYNGPLHVLVNNAAQCPRDRTETPEGLEVQFATNIMGYFWMMDAFESALAQSAPSRIVNVASYWAGGLDLSDLQFEKRQYDNDSAYRQSKQADRMLTVAFANRLEDTGITVNACHPGDAHSKLSHDLGFGGHETPDEAARTPVWLATNPIGAEVTGGYFEHLRESQCRFATDRQAVLALDQACAAFCQR